MHISVRTFEGNAITLEVQSSDTIKHVKTEIQKQKCIRPDLQRLIFEDKSLENSRALSYYGVGEDSILYLVLRKYFR